MGERGARRGAAVRERSHDVFQITGENVSFGKRQKLRERFHQSSRQSYLHLTTGQDN